MEIAGEDGGFERLAVRADAAEDLDFAGGAFSEEEVAVGREADEARVVEAGGVELNLEASGCDGPGVGGAGNNVGAVIDGLIGGGLRQIGDCEMAANTGGFVSRVGEGGLAGEDGMDGDRVFGDGLGGIGREGGCEGDGGDEGRGGEETVRMIHETSRCDEFQRGVKCGRGGANGEPVTILLDAPAGWWDPGKRQRG